MAGAEELKPVHCAQGYPIGMSATWML